MRQVHKSAERGTFDFGWLHTRHSFSFGNFYDPRRLGFRSLRVINEDVVGPGQGFGMHPHRDMEIITVMHSGVLEHRDSMGNVSRLHAGEVQHMTAGSGIEHAESNPSPTEPAVLHQIWIRPAERGLAPRYAQLRPPAGDGPSTPLAGPAGSGAPLTIAQDAYLHRIKLSAGESLPWKLAPGRGGWLQALAGRLSADGTELSAGDGWSVTDETDGVWTALTDVDLLWFDLA